MTTFAACVCPIPLRGEAMIVDACGAGAGLAPFRERQIVIMMHGGTAYALLLFEMHDALARHVLLASTGHV